MNTKWKIILMVMLIIASICGVFTTLLIVEFRRHLEELVSSEVTSMRAIIQTLEEESSRNYRNRIQSLINYVDFPERENAINAFARLDREELLRLTTPYLTILKKENPQFATFTWLTPDNHTFLRVHNPALFGDDVSEKRPDIVDANKEQRQHTAYKIAGPGLMYSIVQPVSYLGRHVGVLQFGIQETLLLDNLYKKIGHPVGVAIPNQNFSFVTNPKLPFLAGNSHTIQSNQLELFTEGVNTIDWTIDQPKVTLHGTSYIIANIFTPLNFNQEPEGNIFVALDISKQKDRLYSTLYIALLVSSILLLLSFFILYSSYGFLVRKITGLNDILEKNNLELESKIIERTTELSEEKERLQAITENVPGVVFQFYAKNSGETGVYYTSPKLYEIFALEFIDNPPLLLQAFFQNIHQEDQQSWMDSVQEAVAKQIPWKWKGRYVKPSGEILWFEGRCSTPTVREDEIIFNGILIDITGKRQREKQKLETLRQREQLKKHESLKTMAGAIAHRFNNAMMAVQGNLELISDTLSADSNEYKMASDATKAANGAAQVGAMMLRYVGQQPIKPEMVPLENLVRESVTTLKDILQPPISLQFIPPEKPLYCSVDQKQIKEVLISIITNAVESLDGESKTIEITVGSDFFTADTFPPSFQKDNLQDGIYNYCQITDSGHGIPPKDVSRIFEPFYTTRFVGRGLGLALTVSIMQSHHGTITVESSPDQGTTVNMLLPVVPSNQQVTPSYDFNGEDKKLAGNILLADDEEMILSVGKKILERLGFTVYTAINGREALELICRKKNVFCAAVLDISMPEMNGIEAMQAIRESNPALPVILTSGKSEDDFSFKEEQENKPDAYLSKPFTLSEIRSVLEKIVS